MASDMSVYVVTWAAFSARHSPDSVTIDGSDAWRFRNISLILVAIGVVFNGIFHVSTIEKSAKPIEMPQTSSAPLRSKVVHEEEGDVACSETVPITIVPMRWRDWFREKHYFQVMAQIYGTNISFFWRCYFNCIYVVLNNLERWVFFLC